MSVAHIWIKKNFWRAILYTKLKLSQGSSQDWRYAFTTGLGLIFQPCTSRLLANTVDVFYPVLNVVFNLVIGLIWPNPVINASNCVMNALKCDECVQPL